MGIHDESISSPIAGVAAPAILRHFYTNKTWMEGETLRQLNDIAQLNGAITVAAFPDLHPGKYGPTGMALLAERLHPLLIGNDIGCGMSLFALDLPLRKLRLHKAEQRLRELEHQNLPDIAGKMAAYGLAPDLFSENMGTIGGGNHFCELQAVNQLFSASSGNLFDEQTLYLLVHSGSRGLGAAAFSSFLAHNTAGHDGLEPNSPAFTDWKKAHDQCVVWASLNRELIAERAAKTLHADLQLIADVPHNLVRFTPEGIVHHKGSAVAHSGDLIPIAGSRASLSYVVRACDAVAQVELPRAKEVNILPEDVRFEALRAGGPGGQHQNTTDSAVRIVHIPTGIQLTARNERSQHRNKAAALQRLKDVLQHFQEAELENAKASRHQDNRTIERGNEIKTFRY